MEKPLTREEFLDKRNSELHRELLGVFEAREEINKATSYLLKLKKEHPYLFCDIDNRKAIQFRPKHGVFSVFYSLIEMLKDGELIVKTKK